jgi:two-component sensor histidine kinase
VSSVKPRRAPSPRLQFRRSYLPDLHSVRIARDLSRQLPGSVETRGAARSIIAELATNACRHARTKYTVTLTAEPAAITVEVSDQSALLPELLPLAIDSDHGRGLHIVIELADEWGTTRHGFTGKTVWARIDRQLSMPDDDGRSTTHESWYRLRKPISTDVR